MTVDLIYRASVYVEVDLDTGTVVSVKVDDEGATAPGSDDPDERTALAIAETHGWPQWELGLG